MKRFVINIQLMRNLRSSRPLIKRFCVLGWGYLLGPFMGLLLPTLALAQTDVLSQPLTLHWKIEQVQGTAVAGESGSDRIYLVTDGGAVQAVRVSDGQLLWRADLGGQVASTPFATQTGVVLASEATASVTAPNKPGQLRQLTRQGGITVWATLLPSPWEAAIASSATALYGCGRDARMQAVNKSDGRILWSTDKSVQCAGAPVVDQDKVFVSEPRGDIVAVSQSSGAVIWRYRTQGTQLKNLAIDDDSIYAGAADGTVYAITRSRGVLRWVTRAGAGTQFMSATAQGILITSLDNYAYCLGYGKGKRRWKFRLDGRPMALPVVNDHSVFLLNSSGNEGIVLDLKTGKPVNRLTLGPELEPAGNPLLVDNQLIILTRQGLVAYSSAPTATPAAPAAPTVAP